MPTIKEYKAMILKDQKRKKTQYQKDIENYKRCILAPSGAHTVNKLKEI